MPSTTTIGIPYPVAADNNDVQDAVQDLAVWLDPVIEASYTSVEIAALAGVQLWDGRRVFDTTRKCHRWYDLANTTWRDEAALILNADTGTTYTLVLADANGKLVTLSDAAAIALTVPTNASVAFPIGTVISLCQIGAGQVTISGAGVTLRAPSGLKLRVQWSMATLVKIGTDEWVVSGDVVV